MVEHAAHNRGVAGSIPATATSSGEPVLEALRSSPLLPDGARLLIAVSGGADSTALLVGVHECGLPVVAAHFDHALRPSSDRDTEVVRALCERLAIPLITGRRMAPLAGGSRQAAARDARYAFLREANYAAAADLIVLAHTADDVVEGVLLHMLRGTGLAGLRGMPLCNGDVVRPLGRVWRLDIEAFLNARGIAWIEDPSNADHAHARARVRHQLIPELESAVPGLRDRLLRIADNASRWRLAVEREAESLVRDGGIARAALEESNHVVAGEALVQLYARSGGRLPALSRRHLNAMLRAAAGPPAEIDLPGGIVFRNGYESVRMVRRTDVKSPTRSATQLPRLRVQPCGDPAHAQAKDHAHLRSASGLRVGVRAPGLRMRPLGGAGTRKLQDLLVDAKVPRHERDSLPLVFARERLAWVPGIAVDRDLATCDGEACVEVSLEFDFSSQERR